MISFSLLFAGLLLSGCLAQQTGAVVGTGQCEQFCTNANKECMNSCKSLSSPERGACEKACETQTNACKDSCKSTGGGKCLSCPYFCKGYCEGFSKDGEGLIAVCPRGTCESGTCIPASECGGDECKYEGQLCSAPGYCTLCQKTEASCGFVCLPPNSFCTGCSTP